MTEGPKLYDSFDAEEAEDDEDCVDVHEDMLWSWSNILHHLFVVNLY